MSKINPNVLPQRRSSRNPADEYLEGLGSRRSAVTMRSCLNRVARMFGHESFLDCEWGALRRVHCQRVLQRLKNERLAPATLNVYLACLKGVARAAWVADLMPQSAYLKISDMSAVRYERLPVGRALNLRECKRLLNVCDDGTICGIRDKAILALMMGCGLRRTEVVELAYANWNRTEGTLTLIGKGNKERRVYLPDDLQGALADWAARRGDKAGPMFWRLKLGSGNLFEEVGLHPGSVYRLLKERSGLANLGGVTPHDLRRTFATRMLESGCDLFLLQRAMGHASVTTTARYDRRTEKSREKVCRGLRF